MLVGIPDGMGALAGKFAENGTYVADKAFMTVFPNHEIRPGLGVARAHGQNGAFADTTGTTARSFDNLTVDADGSVIVQEDPGNSSYIAKTWKIDPVSGDYLQVFESDRDRFVSGAPGFLTQDEENSGVIEVTDIVRNAQWYESGRRYFLGNMQAHYPIQGELVEGGQLYLMALPKPAAAAPKGRR